MIKQKKNFLDINSKTGEFAVALFKRAKLLSDKNNEVLKINNRVYSIPSSLFAKEIVKKTYKLLGLDLNSIAGFTSEDLTKKFIDKKLPKDFLKRLFDQKEKISDIHI